MAPLSMVALLAHTFVRVTLGISYNPIGQSRYLGHGEHANVPGPLIKDGVDELENVYSSITAGAKVSLNDTQVCTWSPEEDLCPMASLFHREEDLYSQLWLSRVKCLCRKSSQSGTGSTGQEDQCRSWQDAPKVYGDSAQDCAT
jgi:hypothetical protein